VEKMAHKEKNKVKTKKKNKNLIITLISIVVLIIIVLFLILPKSPSTQKIINKNTNTNIDLSNSPIEGNPNAPVTIIEYSDFQCPFCGRFYSNTLKQIRKQYIDTNKAKLIYKQFPLTNIHQYALKAAEASECVRTQGGDTAFFKYHDKLYSNQELLNIDNLKKWAQELDYNINSCLDTDQYKDLVNKEQQEGINAGVNGTPTFFINGVKVVGAQPFSVFQQTIDSQLNNVK